MVYMVAGSGISGISAARMLLRKGYQVLLFDTRVTGGDEEQKNKDELIKKVFDGQEDLEDAKGLLSIEFSPGKPLDCAYFEDRNIDICVMSPGIPQENIFADGERNVKVIGEVELAYRFSKGKLAAITGTNGKTTTTTLVGEIFKAWRGNAFVVGNIGNPYTSEALKMKDDSYTVAEISSFMLETTDKFHPQVSSILNITPDHLNRHKTMECYIQMKKNITKRQTMDDVCVLNYGDDVLHEFGEILIREKKCQVLYFSSDVVLKNGLYYLDDCIYFAENGNSTLLLHVDEMNLIGIHNYENVMAAIGICKSMGVPMDIIIDTVKSFKAVEHRIEYVDTVNGVKYYNDSKGTNPDAAIRAIKAMKSPTVLIGGGYDKGSDYADWIKSFDGKVKKLILIGATRENIAEECRRQGFLDYEFADTFEEAFSKAVECAKSGENVLLSPACASWGMFDNFEQRGNVFKELVHGLV